MPELSNEDAGATSWRILCNDNNLLDAVALDCEMIQLRGGRQALARCSVVNWHGAALFGATCLLCTSRTSLRVAVLRPAFTGLIAAARGSAA
eukprot:6190609-Pleurochrysis_carterae.AAC.5